MLSSIFESLAALVQPWADIFAEHTALATAVIAVHVLGMFVAGGMAIGADRAILRAPTGTAEAMRAVVADLATTHTVVIGALGLTVASGVALFASDVPTFSVSKVYWIKMGCVAALLVNGLRMRRAEHTVLRRLEGAPSHTAEMPVPAPFAEWRGVRSTAMVSFILWLVTVLLGVILTNG